MTKIRHMIEADIEQVSEIENAIFSSPWSRQDFIDSLNREDTIYLVAYKENEILGYCGLWNIVDEGNINNVAVAQKHRGRQIGYEMLTQLIERGNTQNIKAYTLEVRQSNEAAMKLYQKLGFVNEGLRKNFYDNPKENAIIMWKR